MTARKNLLAAILTCGTLCAQSARFEVASIKPGAPGGQGCGINRAVSTLQLTHLQLATTDCSLRNLITDAFALMPWELDLTNAPAWVSSEHYDILAKSAKPTSVRGLMTMLGPLLEDRFRLKWHREKKQLPVYYLTVAKAGVKLTPTKSGTCVPFDHNSPPLPPIPGNPTSCDYILFPGTPDGLGMGIEGTGVPMSSLASRLSSLLGRPVVDTTDFTGIFDIHLKFARDSSLAFGGRPDEPGQSADPSGLPNIFTAIRSLGLNITAGKGPVDVFVIDSVQRPTEN